MGVRLYSTNRDRCLTHPHMTTSGPQSPQFFVGHSRRWWHVLCIGPSRYGRIPDRKRLRRTADCLFSSLTRRRLGRSNVGPRSNWRSFLILELSLLDVWLTLTQTGLHLREVPLLPTEYLVEV